MNVVKNKNQFARQQELNDIVPGSIVRYAMDDCFFMVTDKRDETEILLVDIEDGEHMYYEKTSMPEEVYDAEIILTKRS